MHSADIFALSGRVAVVTGALGKLGPIWCRALLHAGANVAAVDLPGTAVPESIEKLQSTVEDGALILLRADVTDRASLETAYNRCGEMLGTPTILVNNAGIDAPPEPSANRHRLEDIPGHVWDRVLGVNVTGLFASCQIFGEAMIQTGSGSIINIGSLYASVSPDARFYDHLPGDPPFLKPPAYGASKAAVVNLTRYLATHWARHGVRVNTLSPGGVLGEQDDEFKRKFVDRVPLGRMATSQDLVGPLLFLASDASRYVTGIELIVDGGFTAW